MDDLGHTGTDAKHDSAIKQVMGRAEYTDDIPEPIGTLHAYLGCSKVAHGTIRSLDLSAVLETEGVIGVLTAADIPGVNDVSAVHAGDEPVLARSVRNGISRKANISVGRNKHAFEGLVVNMLPKMAMEQSVRPKTLHVDQKGDCRVPIVAKPGRLPTRIEQHKRENEALMLLPSRARASCGSPWNAHGGFGL